MLEFLKNLKNNTPIITPDMQRQQANLDALNAVSTFQDLIRNGNTGFSPQSVDLINKIGADKVAEGIGQGLNNGVPEIADWINQYNKGMGRDNPLGQTVQEPAQEEQVLIGGVNQKASPKTNIMSSLNDLAAGYRENAAQPFSFGNLEKRLSPAEFKASVNPEDYRTQLTAEEQKIFDMWANDMKAKGLINPNDNFQDYDMQGYWKNEVLNNTGLANGNAQNHFTDKYKMPNHATFSNESIYATGDNAKYAGHWNNNQFVAPRNENTMTKIGEGLGTLARVIDKPLVKSLIVGGLVGATGGSPAQALGYGIKTGNIAQQAQLRNQIYRNKLKQMGYSDEDLSTLRGYVGDDVYKTLSDGLYKENMADYRNTMAQIAQDKADTDAMYKSGSLGIRQGMLDVAKQNAATNAKRANIYQQIANKAGRNGLVEGGKNSGSKNPMYGKHLAEYNAILQSGDENKIKYAQNKFIETYGEDPNKALKSENDILKLLEYLGNE